jgi:chaperonin GroES
MSANNDGSRPAAGKKADNRNGFTMVAGDRSEKTFSQGGMKMNIRPLQDRLIVKRIEEEEKTKGGIIIPDAAKEKPMQGEVIAVGKGKVLEDGKVMPLDVKQGDRILFGKYAGTEIKIDGQEYLIMREDDVLGILE